MATALMKAKPFNVLEAVGVDGVPDSKPVEDLDYGEPAAEAEPGTGWIDQGDAQHLWNAFTRARWALVAKYEDLAKTTAVRRGRKNKLPLNRDELEAEATAILFEKAVPGFAGKAPFEKYLEKVLIGELLRRRKDFVTEIPEPRKHRLPPELMSQKECVIDHGAPKRRAMRKGIDLLEDPNSDDPGFAPVHLITPDPEKVLPDGMDIYSAVREELFDDERAVPAMIQYLPAAMDKITGRINFSAIGRALEIDSEKAKTLLESAQEKLLKRA
jgi:hypothetical protein